MYAMKDAYGPENGLYMESAPAFAIAPPRDRRLGWQHEQTLLHMVREGNLDYHSALSSAHQVSSGVQVQTANPLRQAKYSIIVFTVLCSRAAIEGGLPPEQAYNLGDAYIQQVEDAANMAQLLPVGRAMYADFVARVHRCRAGARVSRQVRQCLDYIQDHLDEKALLAKLAQQVGYTEYYLSRKFKAEVGCSFNDYLKHARVERAKVLLATTEESIQAIADELGFCSRSYFSVNFAQVVGCSPAEYRNRQKGF